MTKEEHSINFLINFVSRKSRQKPRAELEKIGLYQGQPPVLHILHHYNGLTQKEIAEHLKVTPPTLNKSLKRLAANGFVCKKQDEKDKRNTRVYLSDKGNEIINRILIIHNEVNKQMLEGFSDEEVDLLRSFLNRINDNLKSQCTCKRGGKHEKLT